MNGTNLDAAQVYTPPVRKANGVRGIRGKANTLTEGVALGTAVGTADGDSRPCVAGAMVYTVSDGRPKTAGLKTMIVIIWSQKFAGLS